MIKIDEKLKKYLESEEFEEIVGEFLKKEENKAEILNKQLEKFHYKFSDKSYFSNFVDKVLKKYDSEVYVKRWYSRSIEPPKHLLWFLYNYAKKYGRTCNESEWVKHSNIFTSDLVFANGYYFNQMNGQGSVINVIKQTC